MHVGSDLKGETRLKCSCLAIALQSTRLQDLTGKLVKRGDPMPPVVRASSATASCMSYLQNFFNFFISASSSAGVPEVVSVSIIFLSFFPGSGPMFMAAMAVTTSRWLLRHLCGSWLPCKVSKISKVSIADKLNKTTFMNFILQSRNTTYHSNVAWVASAFHFQVATPPSQDAQDRQTELNIVLLWRLITEILSIHSLNLLN